MTTAQALYDKSLEHIGENGHPIDYEIAFALNQKAAAQGHPDAVLAMGWFYFNGFGTPRDLRSAERWYRRSARSGEPKAMFSLGEIACDENNFDTAHYWFELAVKHGHVRAQYWLGKLYWRGLGVSSDKVKALRLFEQAAHANAPEAKRFMRFRNRRKYVSTPC